MQGTWLNARCRDVAWPEGGNEEKGGFTHIIQLYVYMESVVDCAQEGVEFESCQRGLGGFYSFTFQ